jgi:hypothetical protein
LTPSRKGATIVSGYMERLLLQAKMSPRFTTPSAKGSGRGDLDGIVVCGVHCIRVALGLCSRGVCSLVPCAPWSCGRCGVVTAGRRSCDLSAARCGVRRLASDVLKYRAYRAAAQRQPVLLAFSFIAVLAGAVPYAASAPRDGRSTNSTATASTRCVGDCSDCCIWLARLAGQEIAARCGPSGALCDRARARDAVVAAAALRQCSHDAVAR